jgi:hypothetical protein
LHFELTAHHQKVEPLTQPLYRTPSYVQLDRHVHDPDGLGVGVGAGAGRGGGDLAGVGVGVGAGLRLQYFHGPLAGTESCPMVPMGSLHSRSTAHHEFPVEPTHPLYRAPLYVQLARHAHVVKGTGRGGGGRGGGDSAAGVGVGVGVDPQYFQGRLAGVDAPARFPLGSLHATVTTHQGLPALPASVHPV